MAGQSYTTIEQSQTIADTAGNWLQMLDFGQFDPSLGSLLNINVGLVGDVDGSVSIENLEAAPAVFTIALPSLVSVATPDDTVLASVQPAAFTSVSLGAFDGTVDYAGSSGAVLGALTNAATQDVVVQPGTTGTQPVDGTGTIALPVTASTSLEATGPANMQILSQASAGAVVTLDYSYDAATPPGDGVVTQSALYFGNVAAAGDISFYVVSGFYPLLTDSLTTAVQTFSFADSTTGWTNTVAAQQFDPSLGILAQVNFTLLSDIQASVAAENLDPTAANIDTTQTATVTLDAPGSTLTSDASVGSDTAVAAYDGSTDFAGPSGFIEQGLTAGPNSGGTYSSDESATSNDLAAYTGLGTVDLSLISSSTATLDGPGNLLAQLLAQSGATVTVSYTYQPVPIVSDASDTVSFVPGTTAVADPGISLSDAGTLWLTGATVAITCGLLAGDLLSADTSGTGISASYDPAGGTLTLSGAAAVAVYQQVLSSVAFSSSAGDPTAVGSDTTRTLTWTVSDAFAATSAPVTSTIAVQMPATFTSSPTEDVAITQAGTYTVASLQSANSVLLDSPGATLVLDAPLDVTGGFALEAGTLAFDGGTLSVGSYEQTGGMVSGNNIDIVSATTIAVDGGSIVPNGRLTLTAGIAITSDTPGLIGGTLEDGAVATSEAVLAPIATISGMVLDAAMVSAPMAIAPMVEPISVVTADQFAIVPFVPPIGPVRPVFLPAAVPSAYLLPMSADPPATPPIDPIPAGPPYGGRLVTAESLGLDPAQLNAAGGAGPGAPDVWQIMTQTDISGTSGALGVLLNPVDHTWVGLTLQQAGVFDTGVVTAGGPVASLSQFLSSEQGHPT